MHWSTAGGGHGPTSLEPHWPPGSRRAHNWRRTWVGVRSASRPWSSPHSPQAPAMYSIRTCSARKRGEPNMRRMSFDTCLTPLLIGAALFVAPLEAQEAPPPVAGSILSSDIGLSRDAAGLRLEFAGGSELSLHLDDQGAVRLNGERIGSYERRDALDSAWRDLL